MNGINKLTDTKIKKNTEFRQVFDSATVTVISRKLPLKNIPSVFGKPGDIPSPARSAAA